MSLKLNELTVTNTISGSITGNAATVTNGLYTNSTLTAGNLSGTIPSGVLGNSTHYIGTTAIALNRGSASQSLTGVNIDGTAGSISGFGNPTTASTANTIVYRDGNGYITNNYFYTSGGGSERNASGMSYFAGFNSSDYYIRSYTPAAVAAAISGQTMNIVGSSTFVASLGVLNYDNDRTVKRSGLSHYTGYSTGTNRPTTYDYTLQVTNGTSGWEISMDWIATTGPAIYARSLRDCCQNWSSWVRILDSANYPNAANLNQGVGTSNSPSFTGLTVTNTITGSVSGNAGNVTGTVAIGNGGTGATTAANARTNLGATTVGGNFFTLTNPSAITFPRINADNTVSALDAATFRTAIGAGTGTVTSVGGTGTVSGLTLTGTVTTTGSLTLGGTLSVTASNFASQTANTFLAAPNGASGTPTFRAIVAADVPTLNQATTNNAGSVTYLPNRTDGTAYPVLWGAAYTNGSGTIAYSCAAVTILSSTGTLSATSFSGAGTGLTGTASSLTVGTANAVSTGAVKAGGLDTDSVITVKIANSNVTYAKIQNVSATSRVLGRISAGAGVIEELTGANIATIIGTNAVTNATNATTASALTTANSYTVTGLTSNATINIFPPYSGGYSSFLRMGYDNTGAYDYTLKRNGTTGFLEFDGTQAGYIGFVFNSGVVYSGISSATAGAYYFNSTSHGIRRASGTNDVYLFTTTGNLYLGTTGNASQQIIINNSGNLGVGTSPSSYKLDVNGSCHATSFPTSSDGRFKKKIKPLENCVEKVKKMQGVSYEWNEFINDRRDGYSLNTPVFGVIAQDLEKVIPEVVSKWHLSDDCKDARAVDYIRIIPVLIEAIKEQQVELDDLKKRLLALENK